MEGRTPYAGSTTFVKDFLSSVLKAREISDLPQRSQIFALNMAHTVGCQAFILQNWKFWFIKNHRVCEKTFTRVVPGCTLA